MQEGNFTNKDMNIPMTVPVKLPLARWMLTNHLLCETEVSSDHKTIVNLPLRALNSNNTTKTQSNNILTRRLTGPNDCRRAVKAQTHKENVSTAAELKTCAEN